MKYFKFLTLFIFALTLFSCKEQKSQDTNTSFASSTMNVDNELKNIDFKIAKNYFVNNTIDSISNPLIETQSTFDSIFGMATVMGEDGKPTAIDFSKQVVIAVMVPETEFITSIIPSRISKNKEDKIIFSYIIEQGQKTTYTMVPSCILIISKDDKGEVILNEVVMEK